MPKIEYAKSGRSRCKKCKEKITSGSMRIGDFTKSAVFDGSMVQWYHVECFFKLKYVPDFRCINKMWRLRWKDQKQIQELVDKYNEKFYKDFDDKIPVECKNTMLTKRSRSEYNEETKSSSKKKNDNVKNSKDIDSKKDYGSLRVVDLKKLLKERDLETNGRKPELIQRLEDDDRNNSDENSEDIEPPSKKRKISTDKVIPISREEYQKLRVVDLKKKLQERDLNLQGRKSELIDRLVENDEMNKDEESEEKEEKKEDTKEESEEEQMEDEETFVLNRVKNESGVEDEINSWWEIRDNLEEYVSTSQLKKLLKANEMSTEGTAEELQTRVTFAMLFGRPKKCDVCKDGYLRFKGSKYVCKDGNVSVWAKCENSVSVDKVDCEPFSIPSSLHKNEYLKNFTFKPRKPLIRTTFPYGSPIRVMSFQQKLKQLLIESKKDKLLYGCTISLLKCSRSQKEMAKIIDDNGGYCLSTMNPEKVTHVLADKDSNYKHGKKYEIAKENTLPIYDDNWLFDAVDNQKIPSNPKKYLLEGVMEKEKRAKNTSPKISRKSDDKDMEVVSLTVNGNSVIDKASGLADTGEILSNGDNAYSVTLSRTDISSNRNSYYIMQIIKTKGKYAVWRKWGRVGTKIGDKSLKKLSKDEAIELFERTFLDRTGNSWDNYISGNFEKQASKFYPLDTNAGSSLKEIQKSIQNNKSDLPSSIQNLMKMIFDIDSMQNTLLELKIDPNKMPLGFLSAELIQEGFSILSQIQKEIEDKSKDKLLGLTNQFYTLIPQNFGGRRPPLIDNTDMVQEKTELLQVLQDMEIATSLLKASDKKNPIDESYKKLHCKLEPVKNTEDEYSVIEHYLNNTQAYRPFDLTLLEAFHVDREGEAERFQISHDTIHNRQLLWHGSRLTNWAGILSQGLRIAPPEAPVTGYLFGKGIYFSEAVSKSATYCFARNSNNIGLLLLCEVALGDMQEYTSPTCVTSLPKGKNSVKGCGTVMTDPKDVEILDDGLIVPHGKCVSSKVKSVLQFNEFIVYSTNQVKMKYLLKVKFDFK